MKEIIEDTGFRQGFLFKLVIENIDLNIGLQKVFWNMYTVSCYPQAPPDKPLAHPSNSSPRKHIYNKNWGVYLCFFPQFWTITW